LLGFLRTQTLKQKGNWNKATKGVEENE
ncbi:hypothetical protein U950_02607, partial [Staphylococcus aureus 87807-11]